MTDKNESDGAQKRPHATLDLKATEIKSAPPQDAPKVAASDSTAKSSASASASTAKSGPASAADKPASGSAPRPSPTPSKAGAFFTHLAAGIAGGALAIVGNQFVGSHTSYNSLDAASLKVRASEIENRVAALESAPKPPATDPALSQKIADAESRLAKLEETSGAISALREAQDKLAGETKSLGETVAREGADTSESDRIGKLEERLNMLAAADTGPDGNRLPQLAAITGKIADLEASLGAQIAALRKAAPADLAARLDDIAEASEAAKSANQRFDRELSAVRMEAARVAQRADASKAETERQAAVVEAVQEDMSKLTGAMADLKSSVASELKSAAKPADISSAINPLSGKVASLEQSLQGVVKSEEGRNANAERIVLSLELASLKRAVDSGRAYATELELVNKASNGTMDLGALTGYKDTGVPTFADLERDFRSVMNAVIDAAAEPADGSVVERLIAGAKSVVRVRKVSHDAEDQSAEAIVARMEAALKEGRLGEVIEQAKAIPPQSAAPAAEWLAAVKARYAVDQAIASLESELKTSLTAGGPPAPGSSPAGSKPAAKEQN